MKLMPKFMSKILVDIEGIKQQEQLVCVLLRLNFSLGEIASLLDMSSQRLTNMRSRMIKRMTGKKGPARKFDAYIKNIEK